MKYLCIVKLIWWLLETIDWWCSACLSSEDIKLFIYPPRWTIFGSFDFLFKPNIPAPSQFSISPHRSIISKPHPVVLCKPLPLTWCPHDDPHHYSLLGCIDQKLEIQPFPFVRRTGSYFSLPHHHRLSRGCWLWTFNSINQTSGIITIPPLDLIVPPSTGKQGRISPGVTVFQCFRLNPRCR
jgi:hypothetical protein